MRTRVHEQLPEVTLCFECLLVHTRQAAVVALELHVRLEVQRAIFCIAEVLGFGEKGEDLVAGDDVGLELGRGLRGLERSSIN